MRDLGSEELRRVQRGLADDHGHALCIHALHGALDVARAQFVAMRFHLQTANAHDLLLLAGAHAVPNHLRYLVGDKVLASEVDLNDGPYSAIKVFYERNRNIRFKRALFI